MSGDVSGERVNMFLQSIALVAKTTTAMIGNVLDIAREKHLRQAFLTLGTLISRHCGKYPQECNHVRIVLFSNLITIVVIQKIV